MTLDEIFEDFEWLETWQDRYGYLIDLGKKLPALEDALKNEDTRVRGCVSNAWLVIEALPGTPVKYKLRADSDALIVRGLIALLQVLYSKKTRAEIEAVDLHGTFEKLGLNQHLSMSRQNGFFSMVEKIKAETTKH